MHAHLCRSCTPVVVVSLTCTCVPVACDALGQSSVGVWVPGVYMCTSVCICVRFLGYNRHIFIPKFYSYSLTKGDRSGGSCSGDGGRDGGSCSGGGGRGGSS